MRKYDKSEIVIHNWAELKQTTDGRWNRVWDVALKNPIPQGLDLQSASLELSYEGFQVIVEASDSSHLVVSVTTDEWGWENGLYSATYRLFEEIDQLFGTIDTIQGQYRDLWDPWLTRKKYPEKSFTVSRYVVKKIKVGLQINPEQGGISSFGIDEVNEQLQYGNRVIAIEEGGMITKQLGKEGGQVDFAICGFNLIVIVAGRPIPNKNQ